MTSSGVRNDANVYEIEPQFQIEEAIEQQPVYGFAIDNPPYNNDNQLTDAETIQLEIQRSDGVKVESPTSLGGINSGKLQKNIKGQKDHDMYSPVQKGNGKGNNKNILKGNSKINAHQAVYDDVPDDAQISEEAHGKRTARIKTIETTYDDVAEAEEMAEPEPIYGNVAATTSGGHLTSDDNDSSCWTDIEESPHNKAPPIPPRAGELQFQIEEAREEDVSFEYALDNTGSNVIDTRENAAKRKSIKSRRKLGGQTSDSDTSWWTDNEESA